MWFDNKLISVYSYENYEDKYGFDRDGYALKKDNIKVDIQPVSLEKVNEQYGYDIQATYKMFSDEALDESDIVLHNNKTYKIEKIISWNDYSIYLLNETVIDIEL